MANLSIKSDLDRLVICGEFCDWDIDKSIVANKKKNTKYITVNNMPVGEYKIFSSKSFIGGEIYPTNGRDMPNRYFSGDTNETIRVYLK